MHKNGLTARSLTDPASVSITPVRRQESDLYVRELIASQLICQHRRRRVIRRASDMVGDGGIAAHFMSLSSSDTLA